MNKQRTAKGRGIEWTDYTWNPVKGCFHGCKWTMPDNSVARCYAHDVAEGVARSAYPSGFEHHYFNPAALAEPAKVKNPARIFLDSMSDLMGHWVGADEIHQVLDVVRNTPRHSYQLLTKNAPRLLEFADVLPANLWVGVSAPPSTMFGKPLMADQQKRMVARQLDVLGQLSVPVRWMSIEPLSFDIAPLLINSPLQWAVIGAATNGRRTYQPEATWVQNALDVLDAQRTAVFFKGNLQWPAWREAYPSAAPQQLEML